MARFSNSQAPDMVGTPRFRQNTGKSQKFYFVGVTEINNPSSIIARGWSKPSLTGAFCTGGSEREFSFTFDGTKNPVRSY